MTGEGALVTRGSGLLSSLRHRDFALLMAGFATSSIGSWAYSVALAVWLLEETGSPGWLAGATAARFVPALLLSAYGGVLADRFERVRLMRLLDIALCVLMLLLATEMALGASPWLVVATVALASGTSTGYEPAAAALTPQLVPEQALGSANALRNTVDNVCVVAGPALGALALFAGPPAVATVFNAATFAVSALLVSRISARSTPVDVTEGGEAGPLRQALVGIRTITADPGTATLVAFCLVATFVFGTDTVLFVVLSEDVLGTGAEGYGYLLAGLGVGGVAAAALVTRLEQLPRLGTVILLGMAAYTLPTLLFLVVDEPVVAFLLQCVRGAGTLVVDVLAITALQRSVPSDRLARVFGAFDGLVFLAILLGSALVPVLLGWWGLDAVIWAVGLGVPLLCLLGLPWLRRMDEAAAVRRAASASKVALLARCHLFADVREGALEQLAGESAYVDVADGEEVVREGAPADALYVVESGVFGAWQTAEDHTVRPLQEVSEAGVFGEIGLLAGVPRTATVTARTPGRLLRVDGPAFLAALTQNTPSAALLDGASVRLRRTHPQLSLAGAGTSTNAPGTDPGA